MKKVKLVFAGMGILVSSLILIYRAGKNPVEEVTVPQPAPGKMVKLNSGEIMFPLYMPFRLPG